MNRLFGLLWLLLLCLVTRVAAQNTVFNESFSADSLNPSTYPTVTSSSTGWVVLSNKAAPAPTEASNALTINMAGTSSGFAEAEALFSPSTIQLLPGTYIEVVMTFVPNYVVTNSADNLVVGLFNSGGVAPLSGLMSSGLSNALTTFATGGAKGWIGFNANIPFTGASPRVLNRAAQTAANNTVQDVVIDSQSTSVGYSVPAGTSASSVGTFSTTLTSGSTYTLDYKLSLNADGSVMTSTVALYNGTGTTGLAGNTLVGTYSGTFSSANILTKAFDAFALGWRADAGTANPSSVKLTGFTVKTTGGAPWILTQPASSLSVSIGSSLNLIASVGGTVASYQWQFSTDSGVTWANIDTTANTTAATASLTISNVQSSNAGLYRLVATNTAGSVISASSTVTVSSSAVAPTISVNPVGATVLGGNSYTFSVTANGTAPLSYQWQYSADGVSYAAIASASSSSYTISSVSLSNEGYYQVVVTNTAGTVTSTPVFLTVNQPLTINTQPVGASLNLGDAYTLSVTAVGRPSPLYQWYRNGSAISGATAATYAISSASASDAGLYYVLVTNSAGDSVTSSTVAVTVLSPTLSASSFTPTTSSTGVMYDTRLSITFNAPVSVGLSGTIKIYESSAGTVVDTIDISAGNALMKTLRASSTVSTQALPVQTKTVGGLANVNYYPLTISGNTVTLYPRNNVLSAGKTYYVLIDAGVFVDASGLSYAGISSSSGWTFNTKPAVPSSTATRYVVAADGSGDFYTVQAALDTITASNTTPRVIFIKKGTYFEEIYFTAKHYLTFLGEDRTQTVIAYPNNNNFNPLGGSYHRMTFQADHATNVVLANLSITNTTPHLGAQAEAIVLNGSSTAQAIVTNVDLFSYQDTLQINGQGYVTDSHISGDVDYMWGSGPCFFNNCELTALTSGGYFTQIRNSSSVHGYVFLNCTLDSSSTAVTNLYLARIDPSTSNGFPYSEVVWLNCTMGSVSNGTYYTPVAAAGWLLNNTTDQTATSAPNVHFWEYNSHYSDGTALSVASRIGASKQLTLTNDSTTITNYSTPSYILGNSWTPSLAPLIAVAPSTQNVSSGAALTLKVVAVGVPAVSYQWYRNGVAIAGATSATYTVASTGASDAGTYSVTVSNSAGSVSTSAVPVTVGGAAPVIALQPAATSGLQGSTATFSVWAQGDAPLSYQWLKDGSPISGATRQSLHLTGLASSDAGNYSVIVSNAGGSTTSSTASLQVATPATTLPTQPSIPVRYFDVTSYGAVGDGATDNTTAIQAALTAAKNAGGGTVEFPAAAGAYLCGPITVYAKTNLQVNAGATLKELPFGVYPRSTTSPSHFITLYTSATDIEISGGGTIDGDGSAWWAAYNLGNISSRPRMVQINKSSSLLFSGVTFLNSATFHLAFSGACNNVTIYGITISAPGDSPNTDGIDVTGTNYLIQNCSVSDGDDNIVAKPGSVLCSNLYVYGCSIGTGHGVSVGGQTNVGLDGFIVTNCTFNGTSSALRLKADPTQGGPVKNVTFSNLTMTNVTYPILFYSYYNVLGSPGATSGTSQITPAKADAYNVTPPNALTSSTIPTWKNITVSNVTVTSATGYSTIWGLPTSDGLIQNVVINNLVISGGSGFEIYDATNVQFTGTNSVGTILTDNALAITGQPSSAAAAIGGTASFRVTAVGTNGNGGTGPTYLWYLNGTALADGTRADGSVISGSTTATLSITNVAAGDAGSYTCVVSNALDGYNTTTSTLVSRSIPVSATSSAATLTVSIPDLFSYAFGVPSTGLWTSAPAIGRSGGLATLSFTRVRSDVDYLVQRSTDLVTWTDVALNPGTVGTRVTVTDSLSSGVTREFLRVRVTAAGQTSTWIPEGYVALTLPAGASTSYVGHPFDIPAIYHGVVASVSGGTITLVDSPFTAGALVSTPCWLRVVSGSQAGRLALISANTANTLTVDLTDGGSSSVALDVSGWSVAAGDLVEVAPADTLDSMFTSLLTGGTSILSADTVGLWDGTRWVAYYYSTTTHTWLGQYTSTTSQSSKVLRPDEAFTITRRSGRPALALVLSGSVPVHQQLLRHAGGGSKMVALRFPVPQVLSSFAYAGPGIWVLANDYASADAVGRWSGTAWTMYWSTLAGTWLQQGDTTLASQNALLIQPGEALNVLRRSAATGSAQFLSQPLPYSDPRQ